MKVLKVVMAILLLWMLASSCTKEINKQEKPRQKIYVTAESIDLDGQVTRFPVIILH